MIVVEGGEEMARQASFGAVDVCDNSAVSCVDQIKVIPSGITLVCLMLQLILCSIF